jgi:hypothetical protein
MLTPADARLACQVFGFTWACAIFTWAKASKQTYQFWHRSGKINPYIAMVWLEWTTSLVAAIVNWLYLYEVVHPRYASAVPISCLKGSLTGVRIVSGSSLAG